MRAVWDSVGTGSQLVVCSKAKEALYGLLESPRLRKRVFYATTAP